MLNNFCVFEEPVFFDLWIPDSGFRIPIPESGFRFPGFRVAQIFIPVTEISIAKTNLENRASPVDRAHIHKEALSVRPQSAGG